MFNKVWCSVFGKGTQPFDFIKYNEIRKLANEVKYVSQTSTVQERILIEINKSNKSKVKNCAN